MIKKTQLKIDLNLLSEALGIYSINEIGSVRSPSEINQHDELTPHYRFIFTSVLLAKSVESIAKNLEKKRKNSTKVPKQVLEQYIQERMK
jgi:hypothetical protein